MNQLFKTTLLQPSHIVVPPRPVEEDYKGYYDGALDQFQKDLLEWQKKCKPTELLRWRKFEDEKPKDKFYWKLDGKFNENCWSKNMVDFENFQKCNVPRIKKGRFTEWCYESEYEQAKQQEALTGVLGEGWKWNDGRLENKGFEILFSGLYLIIFYKDEKLHKHVQIPQDLATIDVVIRLIENIEKL